MKANAAQVRAALDKPGSARLVLLHGPDQAVAADLAGCMGRALPGAERIDLDGTTLRADPARLADEAASLSLFGDRRWIRIGNVGEESLSALAALLDAPRAENPAVALSPSLKATSKVVKLALDHAHALAFACYPPSAADAERIAAQIGRDHGLRIAQPIAARLVAGAGGDVMLMTREIEKLALYLDADHERPADLDGDTLDALGADLGEAEADRLVAGVVAGDPIALGAELARLRDSGVSPIPWLRQLQRRFLALAAMRGEIDRGDTPDTVMKRNRVHFSQEQQTARALRAWPAAQLARALTRIRAAERAVMAPGNAGTVLAEEAVESIARAQARRR